MRKMTVINLHKEHNVHPELTDFHLLHEKNRVTGLWEFKGYKCVHCDRTLKFANAVPRHIGNCKKLEPKTGRSYNQDPIETAEVILTKERKLWKPYSTESEKNVFDPSETA